ncbi:YceI family protein [Aquimarina sp. U1-2]|uniref:YceI family protein n=1 Tax=Aquimarina sp. U1-2 TaxID=2823141 RepID=UPI001AECCE24|nr:YceI family protein [Aquimarina sp. U1-2]MBP2830762.1 YceI family protein [Aquimarina sp. U1-2]
MKTTLKTLPMLFAMSIATATFAQKKEIKAAESVIEWTGKKVTGSHNGTIQLKDGFLQFDGDKITGGEFTVDMTTIEVKDLEAGKGKEKLEGHLNSDDFFGTSNHKTAKLVIEEAKKSDTNTYKINAVMTIKGKTNPLNFDLDINGNTAKADVKIDRTKYDIKYGSGSFFDNLGDKAIYDEFTLNVKLEM